MNDTYCDQCPDEDTDKCDTCQNPNKDMLAVKLRKILDKEQERIKG